MAIRHILVIGSGTMGAGIAQTAAQAGFRATLYDVDRARLVDAQTAIARFIRRAAEKGQMSPAEAEAAIDRIAIADDLALAAPTADCVIEAIFEEYAAKTAVWQQLAALLPPHALAASNTSGLSITRLGVAYGRPARFVGLHFFNPVPLMQLVEVVRGADSDPDAVAEAVALGRALGKTVVVCKDAPNFIVNRVNRAVGGEAQLLVAAGVPAQDVDAALRQGAGFRAGPLETGDASGLQIGLAVSENIYSATGSNPRYLPQPIVRALVAAGETGKRAGKGFYLYDAEGRQTPRTLNRLAQARTRLADGVTRPQARPAIGTAPARMAQILAQINTGNVVTDVAAVCPLPAAQPDFYEVQYAEGTTDVQIVTLAALIADAGLKAVYIPRVAEGVVRRCIAMLVNEATYAVADGLASAADIDTAMQLGMNYPHGPFAYRDMWGAANVVATLDRLYAATSDARYRAAPDLRGG